MSWWLVICLTLVGGWLNTLLGPEESAVQSCLVPEFVVSEGCGGWGFWSSFRPRLPVWGLRGLVGLLFEICIVDASIFTAGVPSGGAGCVYVYVVLAGSSLS